MVSVPAIAPAIPSTVAVPKASVSIASGCVRRHSTVTATPDTPAVTSTGQTRSSRRKVSGIAIATITASNAQSRHTRAGGSATAGSARKERTAGFTMDTA